MRKTIENKNQEEAFLCVSTRSDSIHIHPRILLLFFVVSSTRSLVVFLRLIERCFDKRLRRKKREGQKAILLWLADRFLIALFVVEIFHLVGKNLKWRKESIAQSHKKGDEKERHKKQST